MTAFNPTKSFFAFRKDSNASITPLVGAKDPSRYEYSGSAFPSSNLKEALDELFRMTMPKGFQFYSSHPTGGTYTFTVPKGVTKVLVLSIGHGGSAAGIDVKLSGPIGNIPGGEGGLACSAYFDVSPNQRIPVFLDRTGLSDNLAFNFSSAARASGKNKFNRVPFSEDMENKVFSMRAGSGGSSGVVPSIKGYGVPGGGGGSFVCSTTIAPENDRDSWLNFALGLSEPSGISPTNGGDGTGEGADRVVGNSGVCWPVQVSSQPPILNSPSGGGAIIGFQIDNKYTLVGFGGGGGAPASQPLGYQGGMNGDKGGPWMVGGQASPGAVMIFWGPDIYPPAAKKESTNVYQP